MLFAYYLPGKLFNHASHLYTTSRRTISSARALQLFISFAHRRLFVALSCSAMPSALAKASVSSRTHCDTSASISARCSFSLQVVSRVVQIHRSKINIHMSNKSLCYRNAHIFPAISCRRRTIIFFSSRDMYDCEIPSRSATSFCVISCCPESP